MNLDRVDSGRDLPVILTSLSKSRKNADPIKYEVDKEAAPCSWIVSCPPPCSTRATTVTCPPPCPTTATPVDVLVMSPVPLISGVVVRCRALGMLEMTDEAGKDAKLLAVPMDKISAPVPRHQIGERFTPNLNWRKSRIFLHTTRI